MGNLQLTVMEVTLILILVQTVSPSREDSSLTQSQSLQHEDQ